MSTNKKPPSSQSPRLVEIVVGILMLGALAFAIGRDSILVVRDYLTRDTWVQTDATVVRINSKTHWLTYQYTVDGQDYIGTRLTFTDDSESEFEDRRDEYPEGMALTIYYDPGDPSRAVITPEADFGRTILIFITIGLVVVGYFVLRRLFRWYMGRVGNMLSGKQWENSS